MTMKNMSRYFFIGVLLILAPGFFPAYSVARDAAPEDVLAGLPLLEGNSLIGKQYLIQLSGTVLNETFSGAQGLLTIRGPITKGQYDNPYLVVIEGFPKQNSVNSFYWDATDSEMSALMNEITCDIKRSFVKKTRQNFYFLSPALLKRTGDQEVSAVKEAQAKKDAEKVALPTSINSRAGKLKLRIYSNSVSGSVWMKGYDPVEKSYVQYSARLHGKKVYGLRPKLEGKKLTEVKE